MFTFLKAMKFIKFTIEDACAMSDLVRKNTLYILSDVRWLPASFFYSPDFIIDFIE